MPYLKAPATHSSPSGPYQKEQREAEIFYFPITAESDLVVKVRDIVLKSCGNAVSALIIEPLPQKHQSRIWIQLQASAFGKAMHAIISDIPEAELGPIVHIHESLVKENAYAA